MTTTLRPQAAQGKVHFHVRNMGQRNGETRPAWGTGGRHAGRRRPAPGSFRDQGESQPGDRAARRGPDRPPEPGTRLPSSRALAADLDIARNTVAEVYSQLVAEGWLTAQTGSGTCVAPRLAPDTGRALG